eukprot:gene8233-8423_t
MVLQNLLPFAGHWTRRCIPDLQGQVAVITGFNSGIGYETSRALLEHGAEVIGVCRSAERGEQAMADLQEEFPTAKISFKVCNLELLSEVASMAKDLLATGKSINMLINNAGRFVDAPFGVTKEGFEQTLAVDFYGHALLTLLLLPKIISEQAGTLDFDDPKGVKLGTSGIKAYGRAKLMLLLFTYELQRRLRLAGAPVEAFPVHPGVVSTGLFNKVDFRYPFAVLSYLMAITYGQTPLQGAQSTINAATAPELSSKGGSYIGPQYATNLFHSSARRPTNPRAHDVDARVRVWDQTVEQLKEVLHQDVPTLPPVGTRV